jgi:RNA polymerase sigma factor (sigma-70 family)
LNVTFEPRPGDKVRTTPKLTLHADEPLDSSHWTVVQTQGVDGVRAIVLWDALPTVLRKSSDAQLGRMIARSLAVPGARERWAGLGRAASREVRTALFTLRGEDPQQIAFKTLDAVETTMREGLPGRRSTAALDHCGDLGDLEVHLEDCPAVLSNGASTQVDDGLDLPRALATLEATDQELLRLRFMEDLTDAEIGERFGISQQAANMRRKKALQALRCYFSR